MMTAPTPANISLDALAADQSVRFVLAALTRHGAYLQVSRDDAALYSGRNGFAAPLANLEMSAFRSLVSADWIELNGQGQWLLAKAGRDAVRRARSGAANERLEIPNDEAMVHTSAHAAVRASKPQFMPATDPESPLDWLHRRRDKQGRPLLSNHAFDAGERLRADFWFAAMTPRITVNWNPVSSDRSAQRSPAGEGLDMSDNVVAAKQRVRQALAAVGPELSGILIDVCCHEKGIEDSEREVGWPVRSGRIVLQLALERLARHYGLAPPGQAETWTPEGRIRAWGDGSHRPITDGRTASA
jgi:Domain of unknown function (DUF6456)